MSPMKPYRHEDFTKNEGWLVFRLDTQVKNAAIDIYLVMELASGLLAGQELAVGEGLTEAATENLLRQAKTKLGAFPQRILLAKGDSAEAAFAATSKRLNFGFELVPAPSIEGLVAPVKQEFGSRFFSPSSMGYAAIRDDADEFDRESAQHFVPDAYDPCSCASGKKFKFCCKPVFGEIIGAMAAAESGRIAEALKHIAKAKKIAGETSEILCREAIVYSYFDAKQTDQILAKCLALNQEHPRANYIRGLMFKEQGDFKSAITAYETAIANYPKTDRYHLNETYNNLGTAFFETADYARAKSAWEQALVLLPSDRVVRENLMEFIYQNAELPASIREMGPFVRRFFER